MNRKSHPRLCLEVLKDRTAPSALALGSVEVNPQAPSPGIVQAPSSPASIAILAHPPSPCISISLNS